MGSKSKAAQLSQQQNWEEQLSRRVEVLKARGLDSSAIAKDPAVRKIRAKLRETRARLLAIAKLEQRTEALRRLKEEKAAAPKEKRGRKREGDTDAASMSKRQQKKRKKQEAKQAAPQS